MPWSSRADSTVAEHHCAGLNNFQAGEGQSRKVTQGDWIMMLFAPSVPALTPVYQPFGSMPASHGFGDSNNEAASRPGNTTRRINIVFALVLANHSLKKGSVGPSGTAGPETRKRNCCGICL